MSARITAPVPGLNGIGVGGLTFENSVAETDNEAIIAYCTLQGYTVEPIDKTGSPAGLGDLSIGQLDELAAAEDIDLTGHKKSKQTRVDAIEAARKGKAEREAFELDHTFTLTFKDASGDEVTTDRVADDEDAMRTAFSEDPETKDLEIVSIAKKLTGEPTGQA